jgi:hypothetical protein
VSKPRLPAVAVILHMLEATVASYPLPVPTDAFEIIMELERITKASIVIESMLALLATIELTPEEADEVRRKLQTIEPRVTDIGDRNLRNALRKAQRSI